MRPQRIPVNSVIPAVLTPFNKQMEVDYDEFGRHIQDVYAQLTVSPPSW